MVCPDRPRFRPLSLLALLLVPFLAQACQEGTPVAPEGAILRMSVSPSRITRTGTANITIQALRSNGIPVNPGTEIRLSSTIGLVDEVVHTDTDGVARATLRGDGRVGTATITAHSGALEPVTAELGVGGQAASISLSADPTSLPEVGGTVRLIALLRDDEGQPLPDASVNFRTEAGSLDSGGQFLTTDETGEVRDRLRVTAGDAQSQPDRTITVTAESGGAGGAISDSVNISIQGPPVASFTFTINTTIVSFTDTSTGDPTSWAWNFGPDTSIQQSPVFDFVSSGNYIVTLRASNAFGSSEASRLVVIP